MASDMWLIMETRSCHVKEEYCESEAVFKLNNKADKCRIITGEKNTALFVPSYKCAENPGRLQPGCHSLLRPELLTQYRTVIRPSADQTVFIFQRSRGSWILHTAKCTLMFPRNRTSLPPDHHIVSLSLSVARCPVFQKLQPYV